MGTTPADICIGMKIVVLFAVWGPVNVIAFSKNGEILNVNPELAELGSPQMLCGKCCMLWDCGLDLSQVQRLEHQGQCFTNCHHAAQGPGPEKECANLYTDRNIQQYCRPPSKAVAPGVGPACYYYVDRCPNADGVKTQVWARDSWGEKNSGATDPEKCTVNRRNDWKNLCGISKDEVTMFFEFPAASDADPFIRCKRTTLGQRGRICLEWW